VEVRAVSIVLFKYETHHDRSHIFKDLRPYVCTSQNCLTPDHMFGTCREWFRHELELHRREWFCDISDCTQIFETSSAFRQHTLLTHPDVGVDGDMLLLKQHEQVSSRESNCPLCGISMMAQKLKGHLGRHLQQIALFVLPGSHSEESGDGESDYDESDPQTDCGSGVEVGITLSMLS